MTRDYLPPGDAGFLIWLQNFNTKLATHAVTVGVPPAEVTQFLADYTAAKSNIDDVAAIKASLQSSVSEKDDQLTEMKSRLRITVNRMKLNSNFTQAIGEDLGVVPSTDGRSPSIRIAATKPAFQVTMLPDKVRLDWVKGESDGVAIQCKRGAEANFTFLDKDTKSPYDDARRNIVTDQPETRIYRMRYLAGDEEVGSWSDEVRALCMI